MIYVPSGSVLAYVIKLCLKFWNLYGYAEAKAGWENSGKKAYFNDTFPNVSVSASLGCLNKRPGLGWLGKPDFASHSSEAGCPRAKESPLEAPALCCSHHRFLLQRQRQLSRVSYGHWLTQRWGLNLTLTLIPPKVPASRLSGRGLALQGRNRGQMPSVHTGLSPWEHLSLSSLEKEHSFNGKGIKICHPADPRSSKE